MIVAFEIPSMLSDFQATSQFYWTAALVAALIDVFLLGWLFRQFKSDTYCQLQPSMTVISMLFWSALYVLVINAFWDSCYQFFFPDWVLKIVFPFGLLVGLLGLPFWWISLRLPGNPLWWFTVLGGLHSLLGHFPAIYDQNILERCPMLTGVSARSVLVFGIFEFILYWSIVLIISAIVQQTMTYRRNND